MTNTTQKETSPNEELIQIDPYSTLAQLVTSAEAITWNRFNNFLVSNTILMMAWATVYAGNKTSSMSMMVLVVMTVVGFTTCPMWAALGSRGRGFLKAYIQLGSLIEDDNNLWPKEFDKYKPFKKTEELREELPWNQFGSFFILTFIPWLFAVLYLALFAASIIKC